MGQHRDQTRKSSYFKRSLQGIRCSKIKAIYCISDLVSGSIKRVFDQVGIKAGEIPVVGWGNSIDTARELIDGYVNAAMWQDPQVTSYMALSMGLTASLTSRQPDLLSRKYMSTAQPFGTSRT
jgi:ABC-type sugar transport system substrate-binding protein